MPNSELTKRSLAASFRRLLATTPVERVTVSAIAADCGVNRQTFYYHFHDVYDLVGWVIDDEVRSVLDADDGNWQETMVALLKLLRDDRMLIVRRMRSVDPVTMYHLLKDRLVSLVGNMVGERCPNEPQEDRALAADFFAGGLAEVALTWLENGCETEPEQLVARIGHALQSVIPASVPQQRAQANARGSHGAQPR